jgi:hypothetical protein
MTNALPLPVPTVLNPDGYENVCNCRFSDHDEKREYLLHLCACGNDKAAAERHHSVTRVGRLRLGPKPDDVLPDEGLGVLMRRTDIIRFMASKFKFSPSHFTRMLEQWISYSRKRSRNETPTDDEAASAEVFLRSKLPTRADGEAWLFRNPTGAQHALDGLDLPRLAWRLGLHTAPGDERLGFSFPANLVEGYCLPRFYDATWSYLDLWSWTGKTKPNVTHAATTEGLRELLADPPEFRHVNPKINIVVTQS